MLSDRVFSGAVQEEYDRHLVEQQLDDLTIYHEGQFAMYKISCTRRCVVLRIEILVSVTVLAAHYRRRVSRVKTDEN